MNVDRTFRNFLLVPTPFSPPWYRFLHGFISRDPGRIGLCLHVLSRVVRDNVPDFAGPFLKPRSDDSSSNKSSSDENIVDDGINDGQMGKQRGVPHSPGGTIETNLSTTALAPEELHREDRHRTRPQQQQQDFPATTDGQYAPPPLMHLPQCPPPARPAPSHVPAAALPWSLDPSTTASSGVTVTDLTEDSPPPSTPQNRPVSLPSKFSLPANGDPIWDSLFPPGVTAAGIGGGDGGGGGGDDGAWRPAATWRAVSSLKGRREGSSSEDAETPPFVFAMKLAPKTVCSLDVFNIPVELLNGCFVREGGGGVVVNCGNVNM